MRSVRFVTLPALGARFALLMGLWAVLSGGNRDLWWFGVLVVAAGTAWSALLSPCRSHAWRARALPGVAWFFLVEIWRSGVAVARVALDPRCHPDPEIFTYPLRLSPGSAPVFLANLITLLPGTLSVDIRGTDLLVHTLLRSPRQMVETAAVEGRVAVLFGAAPLAQSHGGAEAD